MNDQNPECAFAARYVTLFRLTYKVDLRLYSSLEFSVRIPFWHPILCHILKSTELHWFP